MGVVTISSSASRTHFGLSMKYLDHRSASSKRPLIVAFKADEPSNKTVLVAPNEPMILPIVTRKEIKNRTRKAKKALKRVKAVVADEATTSTAMEVDYNEAAAKLESIFKLSPATETLDENEVENGPVKKGVQRRRGKIEKESVIRTRTRKAKRLSLEKRIELKQNKEDVDLVRKRRDSGSSDEKDKVDKLLSEYSASTDLVSLDWKKMKIPPVLLSSEHTWLFKLMQPLNEILKVSEGLEKIFGREPTQVELAESTNMSVVEVKRHLEVGRAARNKLIKHNLRLVLFVMNKYFHDFTNGSKFQDLCQAGIKGLITAIDRFEPKRRVRLSTYGLFWIRHAIIRSMTVSSFTRVSFGLESVRAEIQKAKLELNFENQRPPTDEEIAEKAGISVKRYHEVTRALKPVISLNSKHIVTQEELINAITDVEGASGDDRQKPAVLRLAIDDVLDSLKPKESLVIRQRFGLDGKGDRTLGEIAGNLNISREMVRKYEVKALMKLKHPARLDYLRQYMV